VYKTQKSKVNLKNKKKKKKKVRKHGKKTGGDASRIKVETTGFGGRPGNRDLKRKDKEGEKGV